MDQLTENDKEFLALAYKHFSNFGPRNTALLVHIAVASYKEKKFTKICCDYQGFFASLNQKQIVRVYGNIASLFVTAFVERSFLLYLSSFQDEEGNTFSKEWLTEFHYYYWAFRIKTSSHLLTNLYGFTTQEQINDSLLLFKDLSVVIGWNEFYGLLHLLHDYPNKILSRYEIENIARLINWDQNTYPKKTDINLADEIFEELQLISHNICKNSTTSVITDLYNTLDSMQKYINYLGLIDENLLSREEVMSTLPFDFMYTIISANKLFFNPPE